MKMHKEKVMVIVVLLGLGCLIWETSSLMPRGQSQEQQAADFKLSTLNELSDLADVPAPFRKQNWRGDYGFGSCVHASVVTLLQYHGLDDMADYWAATYNDGERFNRLEGRLDAVGLHYASVYGQTDLTFLEWACRNRLGSVIGYTDDQATQAHALTIVDLTPDYAVLIDNNHPLQYDYIPRAEFERIWLKSGGVALTFLYSPTPPWPAPNL